jgi:transcription antitermination factor NusG
MAVAYAICLAPPGVENIWIRERKQRLMEYLNSVPSFYTGNPGLPWFALRVRSRYEGLVATILRNKGFEGFLPTYICKRRWSDRVKEMELPLFPGYVFCRFNPLDRLPILTTPGLISIVGIARNPVPIEEAEIAALQAVMTADLPRKPWPYLQVGQRVRIEYGALCGLEGILLEFRKRNRIALSVTLLQRSVAVEIESTWVSSLSHTDGSMRLARQSFSPRIQA